MQSESAQNMRPYLDQHQSVSQADYKEAPKANKLSIFETILALIACNFGAGLLGLPFAMYNLGMVLAAAITVFIATLTHFSSMMYLETAQLTPGMPKSIYEIAYSLLGRNSIFFICGVLFLSNFGACVLFYKILGDTLSSISKQILLNSDGASEEQDEDEQLWWVNLLIEPRALVILLSFLHTGTIFKRQLEEMKIVSYSFAVAAFIFMILFVTETIQRRDSWVEHIDWEDVMSFKSDNFTTAVNIVIFAFSYQWVVLPAYSELENKSHSRFATASIISNTFFALVYTVIGYCGIFLFGSKVDADLLINVVELEGAVSVFSRIVFIMILMFHIPYFFFMVKECWLVTYDEFTNRSMSHRMDQKLAEMNLNLPTLPSSAGGDDELERLLGENAEEKAHELEGVEQGDSETGQEDHSTCTNQSQLTYKQLPDVMFFWSALYLQLAVIFTAVTVSSITNVFDIIGGIGGSSITFLFPGLGYLVAQNRYGITAKQAESGKFCKIVLACFFLGFYLLVLYLFFASKFEQFTQSQTTNLVASQAQESQE